MKKNSGVAYLGIILIVIVVVVGAFFIFSRNQNKNGQAPWERLENITSSDDADDACGNSIGNGAEIISGPKKGAKSFDQDNPFRSLTVHPTDPNIIYVGTERNGIVKSVDGGKTWERQRYGIRHSREGYPEVYDIAIAKTNPDILYAAITGGPGPLVGKAPSAKGGVYKSVDGGETWQRKNCGLSSGAVISIWVDPEDENHAIVGLDAGEITYDFPGVEKGFYPGGIFQIFDGGEMWEEISGPEGIEKNSYIHVKGSGSTLYTIGTYGRRNDNPSKNLGLIKSSDNGKTWQLEGTSVSKNVGGYFDISPDGKTIYASDAQLGIWVSEDGGKTWELRNRHGYVYIPTVDPTNPKRVFFGRGNDLLLTEDGFNSSKEVINRKSRETVHISDIVFAPSDPSIVYMVAVGYDLYKSTDSGETFSKVVNLREDVLNKIP